VEPAERETSTPAPLKIKRVRHPALLRRLDSSSEKLIAITLRHPPIHAGKTGDAEAQVYANNFRRIAPTKPIKPLPSRIIEEGSGVEATGSIDHVPDAAV